jgi:hypothetical protein
LFGTARKRYGAGLALPFVYFGFWLLYWLSYRGEVLVLVVGANVALFLAGWNFIAVLDELRRSLPPQFTVGVPRVAVGYYIWTPLASDAARRRFIASYLWFALFALCVGMLLLRFYNVIGAALCGGLAVVTLPTLRGRPSATRGQSQLRHDTSIRRSPPCNHRPAGG